MASNDLASRRPEARRLDLRAVAQALAAPSGDSITMAQMASELGVAKPTLYRLAGSRSALIDACLDAEAERLLDHLRDQLGDGDGGALLEPTLRALAHYADDSPGGFALLFERCVPGADVRVRRAEVWLAGHLRRLASQAGNGGIETTAAGLLGAGAAIVAAARREERAVNPAEMAAQMTHAVAPPDL